MKKSPWELVSFYHTLAVEVEYSIMHWNLLVILAESTVSLEAKCQRFPGFVAWDRSTGAASGAPASRR